MTPPPSSPAALESLEPQAALGISPDHHAAQDLAPTTSKPALALGPRLSHQGVDTITRSPWATASSLPPPTKEWAAISPGTIVALSSFVRPQCTHQWGTSPRTRWALALPNCGQLQPQNPRALAPETGIWLHPPWGQC